MCEEGITFPIRDLEWINNYIKQIHLYLREILTNALRTMVNNPFKESFYRKRKKKVINVLTTFFIFHKSSVKL